MDKHIITPKVLHKKDFFDAIGDAIRLPVAIVSGTLTGKLLSAVLGFGGFDEILIVIVTAAVFTVAEVLMFRRWSRHRDSSALLIGCLIALTSIGGSVGYFQVKLQRSILESESYQLQRQVFESWQAKADKQTHPETYAWNAVQAEKAKDKLDEIRHSGAGIGNAFYKIFARLTGWSIEDSALAVTVFIALVLESILIYSAIKSDEDYMRPQEPSPAASPALGNGFAHVSANGLRERNFGFRGSGDSQSQKIVYREKKPDMRALNKLSQKIRKTGKKQRKEHALELRRQFPEMSVSELAERIGVTPQTIRFYFKEMKFKPEAESLLDGYRGK